MSTSQNKVLPVAVIGGGPVGLAGAAHLVTRGIPVKLYEAGETVAAHVRGTCAAVLAVAFQHGFGIDRHSPQARLAGATGRCAADRL